MSLFFYHLKPNLTLAYKGKKYRGKKKSNDCLTVLFCANCDGSKKIIPLLEGEKKLDVQRRSKWYHWIMMARIKKARMATMIFTRWLKKNLTML